MKTRLKIDRLGHQGDGIAEQDGEQVFVPFALPGEEVEAEVSEGRGTVLEVVTPSANRAEPMCQHYGTCGGCQLQHMAAGAIADFKRAQVQSALGQRGLGHVPVAETLSAGPGSRRRLKMKARRVGREVVLGFSEPRSHNVIDLVECPVAVPKLVKALPALRGLLNEVMGRKTKVEVLLTASDGGLDLVLELARDPLLDDVQTLANFAEAEDYARVSWNDEVIAARRPAFHAFGPLQVTPPPGAFLQAAPTGQAHMEALVVEAVGDAKYVADLFSGCGTFTGPLAPTAHVAAYESSKGMMRALQAGADMAAGQGKCNPVKTVPRDLFRNPLAASELDNFDAVVFDPPRAGAKAQTADLAACYVPVLVGVSCNPASFARDARQLVDGGYELERVTPIDQFTWSWHTELVGVFRK